MASGSSDVGRWLQLDDVRAHPFVVGCWWQSSSLYCGLLVAELVPLLWAVGGRARPFTYCGLLVAELVPFLWAVGGRARPFPVGCWWQSSSLSCVLLVAELVPLLWAVGSSVGVLAP
jgi:hypothetical protein